MAQKKGTLLRTCVSVPEADYVRPERLHYSRIRARQLGRRFKSGVRKIRFDGVTVVVTIITIRDIVL